MKQRRDVTPIVLSLLLLVGIIFLTFLRHSRGISVWAGYSFDLDIIFVGLYVIWILFESPVARKDVSTEGKQTLDFGTCQVYALGQAFTFLSALWFPSIWCAPGYANFAGIFIFLCGIIYRLWAIRTLGQFYSHKVRKIEEHQIVDSGPYRIIRHPAYAGMIVANAGLTLYFFNWVTLAIFLFVLTPSIILRIFIEEKMLYEIEGYADFAKKRSRLFPGLW